jgi:hypothetical protein
MSHNQGGRGVQNPPQVSQATEPERDIWLIGPPNNHPCFIEGLIAAPNRPTTDRRFLDIDRPGFRTLG